MSTEDYKAMDRRVVDEIINNGNLDVVDKPRVRLHIPISSMIFFEYAIHK